MSHEKLPDPLPGAPALRAHLKALERGVADARTQRLGVPAPPARLSSSHAASPSMGSMIGGPDAPHTNGSYVMPKPGIAPPAASSSASGKPRASRAKSASDFSAFFNSIDKRAAS